MTQELVKSREIAKIYQVSTVTVMEWHRAGIIPSEVHVGHVIRFNPEKVAKALARHKAAKVAKPRQPKGEIMLPVL